MAFPSRFNILALCVLALLVTYLFERSGPVRPYWGEVVDDRLLTYPTQTRFGQRTSTSSAVRIRTRLGEFWWSDTSLQSPVVVCGSLGRLSGWLNVRSVGPKERARAFCGMPAEAEPR